MIEIKLKSGGVACVWSEGERRTKDCPINFTVAEYDYAKKISRDVSDPEATREFWKVVIEKKLADPNYSVFQDFPVEGSGDQSRPAPASPSASAAPIQDSARREFKGAEICREIIQQLKPGKGESA